MLTVEAPIRDNLQAETTNALELRDSLAARWIARPGGVNEDSFKDPLDGFPTKTILNTISRKIDDFDAIEMAIVSRTLVSMHRRQTIPTQFVPQCIGIVSQIKTRQLSERGRIYPIKPA